MHVEEVHAAEHQQDLPDLDRQQLDRGLQADDRLGSQRQGHEPEVHEIEADEQQVVDRVRRQCIVVEGVEQEGTPVLVQRVSHPNGEGDAEGEVDEIGADHAASPSGWF